MKLTKAIFVMIACAMIAAWPLALHAQTPGQNLLADGDFEAPPTWPQQDGIGEVQVAPGWRAWYIDPDQVPAYVKTPNNCKENGPTQCYWMRPEFRDTVLASFPNRVHGGIRAQKYFSYGRMHEAGLYQRVTGITPGARLRFSIYVQAWQCFNIDNCGKNGIRSDDPANMHLRVGIDPFGGSNPFSANIVWSPEREAFDRWVEFSVETQAKGDAVTVFTHSRAEWDYARQNNDVYLDDASLVVVGPGQSQPATAAPAGPTQTPGTPAPTRTPAATRTPRPDGAVVHVVQPGDTLYAISLQYDVPLQEIYQLNNLTRESILSVGQEIVIKVGQGTVVALAATATKPGITLTAPLTLTVVPPTSTPVPPTATPLPSGLCLGAFEDLNANTLRDGNEPGLAGVTFVVNAGVTEVARQVTDNSGKLTCLSQLPPGAYSVQITLPPGYIAPYEEIDTALALGQKVDLLLAARQGIKATPTVAPTVQPTPTPSSPPVSNTTLIVLVVLAVIFLVLIGLALTIIRRGR
jgi:LysM repeat protein